MYTKLSAVLLAAVLLPAAARAQQPTRLPGVVITAPVDKPGPRALAGVVRDTFAVAIDSVEISIVGIQRRVHTDSAGKFRFTDLKPGTYDVRARRIGYAPQIQTIVVDSTGGVGTFELLALQRSLPAVIVSAERGGLSGVVGDTSYRALPGATVRILGEGETTTTDSLGRFYFAVKPGKHMLSVDLDGFANKLVGVRVPSDSGRRVSVFLLPRTRPPTARELQGVEAFRSRIAWRNQNNSRIYDREDLEHMEIQWASEAVQAGYSISGGKGVLGSGCMAVLNGGPASVSIDALTIDDLETVEVYTGMGGMLAASGKRGDTRGSTRMSYAGAERAAFQNTGRRDCAPMVFVWTR